ncbi:MULTISPECIES: hypothetical protein [unclassified Sporosarcina]|uniref:hypothetical protein n=1 Tax=unclassified Sporosarcina TaxID=2647733 RepID=UPI0012F50877|nr:MULTISPECIES: hypothetical protein [unclassified Sporosarcina]
MKPVFSGAIPIFSGGYLCEVLSFQKDQSEPSISIDLKDALKDNIIIDKLISASEG